MCFVCFVLFFHSRDFPGPCMTCGLLLNLSTLNLILRDFRLYLNLVFHLASSDSTLLVKGMELPRFQQPSLPWIPTAPRVCVCVCSLTLRAGRGGPVSNPAQQSLPGREGSECPLTLMWPLMTPWGEFCACG